MRTRKGEINFRKSYICLKIDYIFCFIHREKLQGLRRPWQAKYTRKRNQRWTCMDENIDY